ncbi:Dcp1p [Sugiyamaella lignohabitans]|uniref:Dcp1p n=1 Tax=Sugiyamaella lignohabitans TaxID=796027 RepID=A0A167FKM2_9ASCO|nr:Dcp1p [Sugiyamaella lignohabitans]ANB15419.1 Dcp1p [Sugiyamaella lignohabitans]
MTKEANSTMPDQNNPELTKQSYNYAVLSRYDPFIAQIICTSAICNVYKFNIEQAEWDKINCQGTLFVYSRAAKSPDNIGDSQKFPYGLIVLNRLNEYNFSLGVTPLTISKRTGDPEMEFKLEDSFIMAQAADGAMYGLWLFDTKDRETILNTLQWCLSQSM